MLVLRHIMICRFGLSGPGKCPGVVPLNGGLLKYLQAMPTLVPNQRLPKYHSRSSPPAMPLKT